MRSVFYGVLLTVFVAGAGYVQAANDQDYISISDEPAITPIEDINDVLADGSDSAGEGATGIMNSAFSDGVSSESSEEMDSEVRATDRFVGPAVRRVVGDGAEDSGVSTDADMNDANVICLKKYDRKRLNGADECE